MTRPWSITVIGLDGSPLGAEATAALAAATLVAGGRRHLDGVQIPVTARTVEIGDLGTALDAIHAESINAGAIHAESIHAGAIHAEAGHVVVLASGDPGFFGIVRALRQRGLRPRVLPGVSSVVQAFAAAGLAWDDALVVTAHGRPLGPVAATCRAHPKVAVLTAPGAGPAELGAALAGSDRTLFVATSLGTPQESLVEVTPAEASERSWEQPNVVLVLADQAVDRGWIAGGERVPDGWALPEADFEHRDSMVTKAEVRALLLAHLAPRTGRVVWDLGSGSGSVAVECARFGADVVAVEQDPAACQRVAANAARFGVTVDVVLGRMPDALAGLREADAVFLGGGGPPALEAALKIGDPTRVVAAVAALERVAPILEVLDQQGFSTGGSQLAAARLSRLPDGTHRLAGTNPVFVLWGERS